MQILIKEFIRILFQNLNIQIKQLKNSYYLKNAIINSFKGIFDTFL